MNRRELYAKGYYAGLAQEPRFARIIKIFRQLKGERLLDIGCGDGDITLLLKESSRAREVFGIDIASEAISIPKTSLALELSFKRRVISPSPQPMSRRRSPFS